MGWVTDWNSLEEKLSKPVHIDEFDKVIQVLSEWMDGEDAPDLVMGVLRSIIGSDLSEPVVVGHHGEVVKGLPQLLRAYIEGHQYVPVVRLTTPLLH